MLTAAIYAPMTTAPFVYEDTHWQDTIGVPQTGRLVPSRALTMATHRLTPSPGVAHLTNIALHLLNGLLVYAVAATLIPGAAAVWGAGVFLLHPLNSEAVSYVSARTDLLMTLCVLLAVGGALRGWWLAAIGGLIAAATSKEIGVVASAFVLLTLAARHQWPSWAAMSRSRAGALALSIGAIGLGAALGHLWSMGRVWLTFVPSLGGPAVPWIERVMLQNGMLWHLLALVVWPFGFSIDHDVLALTPGDLALAVACTVSVGLLAIGIWRTQRIVAWGVAWALMAVAPRFLVLTSEFLTEPQMYLPMVGISVVAGAGLHALWTWTPIQLTERTA